MGSFYDYEDRQRWIEDERDRLITALPRRHKLSRWMWINWPAVAVLAVMIGVCVLLVVTK